MAYSDPSKAVTLGSGELDDLAQTIAALTHGMVTIEDMAARVLAYSRSSPDEADELRRQSILGRSGPPAYLRLLNEWGVYEQLKTPDNVVEIDEHPESSVRRRLAVGVFAGDTQLAIIWVQQGHDDFPPHARQALIGAARLTADQLTRPAASDAEPADPLAEIFAGRAPAAGLGRLTTRPCAVAVFTVRDDHEDRAAARLALAARARVVSVHAAAARRTAIVGHIGSHIYALLPATSRPEEVSAALSQAVDRTCHGVLGRVVDNVSEAVHSRDTALMALPLVPFGSFGTFDALRPSLLVTQATKALADQRFLMNDRLAALSRELRQTLLHYLEHGSDVGLTATAMHVHQTTVRYRLRKIAEAADLDLSDPDERLAAELQLRLESARESARESA